MLCKQLLVSILATAVLGIAILQLSGAALVGTAQIHAPAVVLSNNTGVLTVIKLTVSTGDGKVSVVGPYKVGSSTVKSAETAAAYGADYLGLDYRNYNFTYDIMDPNANVSGPSAGTAMTLLAVSALSGTRLLGNFTVTGTISSNGTIGAIGGVYDKVAAAKAAGMTFAIVPEVPADSTENMLYLLVQDNFDMPLVQAANFSQAYAYASGLKKISNADLTSFDFYTDYNVSRISNATLECTGLDSCNQTAFKDLYGFTYAMTKGAVSNLSADSRFTKVAARLMEVLNQSDRIYRKGYIYTGADMAFLDYLDAFFFINHNTSKVSGLNEINSINNYCNALVPPNMTYNNYEYVLGGELRQAWGEYTANATLEAYNATAVDTDGVLESLYVAGEANAWCSAANFMYGMSGKIGGNATVYPDSALAAIARQRLERASGYYGIYLATANQAYSNGNYPLAILDSDYAYALDGGISPNASLNSSEIEGQTYAITKNATYGVWAQQFSDEARFYAEEAAMSKNATLSKNYAETGFTTAVLASMLSNDTRVIFNNLTTTKVITATAAPKQAITGISIVYILIVVFILLAIILTALFLLLNSLIGNGSTVIKR